MKSLYNLYEYIIQNQFIKNNILSILKINYLGDEIKIY